MLADVDHATLAAGLRNAARATTLELRVTRRTRSTAGSDRR